MVLQQAWGRLKEFRNPMLPVFKQKLLTIMGRCQLPQRPTRTLTELRSIHISKLCERYVNRILRKMVVA